MKTTNMNLDLVTSAGNQMPQIKGTLKSAEISSGSTFGNVMKQTQNLNSGDGKMAADQMMANKDASNNAFTTGQKKPIESKQKDQVEETGNEVASTYANEVKEKLEKLLGLDEKQIEELLASMGLMTMDLLNPEKIIAMVLNQFGATSTADALMNEELSNALLEVQTILDEVSTMVQEEIVDVQTGDVLNEISFDEVLAGAGEEEQNSYISELDSPKTEEVSVKEDITVEIHKETADSKESFSSSDDLGQANGGQETFIDYFANKVDLSNIQSEGMTVQDAKQIVTQLVDQIKLNISTTKTSMEMILNPEALGKVQVVVQNKQGVLTAHLKVENELAKQALETSLLTLKESFENQGLKVEKVEVTIGNYSEEYAEQEGKANEQQNRGSKKKINVDDYFEDSSDAFEEASTAPVASMTGTVEYMA